MKIHCKFDEMVSVEVLKTIRYSKNPNKHSKEQISQLAEIMAYQGIRHAIVVARTPRTVMSQGHGRLLAAIENDWGEFPVVYQDYDDEEQLYADVVADNAIAMQAELELASINLEIPNLGPDFDIDLLGIKNFELEPADKYSLDENEKSLRDKSNTFEATFPNEEEMMRAYQDLCDRGYIVKIKYV